MPTLRLSAPSTAQRLSTPTPSPNVPQPPLRPSVPSTALIPLYGALPIYGPLSPLQDIFLLTVSLNDLFRCFTKPVSAKQTFHETARQATRYPRFAKLRNTFRESINETSFVKNPRL
jgi:hypothetical protein